MAADRDEALLLSLAQVCGFSFGFAKDRTCLRLRSQVSYPVLSGNPIYYFLLEPSV